MVTPQALAAVALQLATAVAAGYGVWLCVRLQTYGRDRRLVALAWFFGLFAASVALHAAWEWQIGGLAPPVPDGPGPGGGGFQPAQRPGPRPVFEPQGDENVTLWLAGHHLLMLASLAVGVLAFGRRRSPPPAAVGTTALAVLLPGALAAVSLAWVSDLVPLMLALQAGLTLYLAVQALLNHLERRSPGALKVFAGFALFFLGHLLFFLGHEAGRGRSGIGDILALVGIVLLVQVLPAPPSTTPAAEG